MNNEMMMVIIRRLSQQNNNNNNNKSVLHFNRYFTLSLSQNKRLKLSNSTSNISHTLLLRSTTTTTTASRTITTSSALLQFARRCHSRFNNNSQVCGTSLFGAPLLCKSLNTSSVVHTLPSYAVRCFQQNPELMREYGDTPKEGDDKDAQRDSYYKKYFESLLSRKTFISVLGSFAIVAVAGVLVFLFSKEQIIEQLGYHGAQVAHKTLADEQLLEQAQALSASLVNELLAREDLLNHAVVFVKKVATQPETQQALTALIKSLVEDPYTQNLLLSTLKSVGYEFLLDKTTLQKLTVLAFDLIQQEQTKIALINLLSQVMQDPDQKKVATDFVIAILQRPEVFDLVNEVARNIVVSILNDDNVKSTAVEFVKQVVSDTEVQKDTGDALYSAVKYAVKSAVFGSSTNKPKEAPKPDNIEIQVVYDLPNVEH